MGESKRQSVSSSSIYDDLLDKIISLKYMPGDGISENELCELYGATRHAIRGALAVLKEKGFIEVFPQKGTYVSRINLKTISDTLFLRSAVEQEVLHVVLLNKDNTQLLNKLEACLNRQAAAEDRSEFYMFDDEFHNLLLKAANRESVRYLYEDAYLHMLRWRNMEVEDHKRTSDLPTEHKNIVAAIRHNDENEARRLMNSHIDSVKMFGDEMKAKYPQCFV